MLLRTVITSAIVVFSVMASMAQTAPPECKSEHFSIPFLTKSGDGWNVSFAKQAKLISNRPYISSDGKDSGIRLVDYEPQQQVITLPNIEVDACNHTGTIQEWYLIPKEVRSFEKGGRPFAYQVQVQMVAGPNLDSHMLGSITNLIFYDMHGDGIFDSVRMGSGASMPLVPDWVKSIQGENKGQAESGFRN